MRQFMTYMAIGVFCALLDIGLMQLLILSETNYILATTAGFAASLCVNFLLHMNLTFKAIYSHGSLVRYLCVVLANYCLTLLTVSIFHAWLDMAILGKILSLPLVAINGYFFSKHWIYRNPANNT
ncbi:GtrA family protein [Comamonas endophytica]|uniref:GtrA family protein n=1 Tax=Comamonas endophytica TaxID=2949090 RepID=A0ABY6G7Q8_9BURK|nr:MULTISPECIES: GtrA family protein [unclassified Acidovorax]MCD2511090.1 GtrA family protein [Acidovorax sp. D4N7]UYG50494.1 GtrA family protein [Acidovorax sp. 5MLIR]